MAFAAPWAFSLWLTLRRLARGLCDLHPVEHFAQRSADKIGARGFQTDPGLIESIDQMAIASDAEERPGLIRIVIERHSVGLSCETCDVDGCAADADAAPAIHR